MTEVEDADARGRDFLVSFVRTLRVAAIHDVTNEAARQVVQDFSGVLRRTLGGEIALHLRIVGESVYFNEHFLRHKGHTAYEAALQAKRIYGRLGIHEVELRSTVDETELLHFLVRYQAALSSPDPTQLLAESFASVSLKRANEHRSFDIDRRLDLARAYAQMIVMFEEAFGVKDAPPTPISRLRRTALQLFQAAEGQESLLAGLTRLPNPDATVGMHTVAVVLLVLLMAARLGVARADLMNLGMSALFHDLGPTPVSHEVYLEVDSALETEAEVACHPGLETALHIASLHSSSELIDRCAAALEAGLPAGGDGDGLIPGLPARLIAVACAYDRMIFPGTGLMGPRPIRRCDSSPTTPSSALIARS